MLTSSAVGGKAITKRIWVPNAVFASREGLLTTLVVGDQIFINAYLLAGTVFARAGGLSGSRFARYAAEFMGAEAVHRALALQALGRLGNDRVFMKFGQREPVSELPSTNQPGFYKITQAVEHLEAAGFGFGKQGATPGAFYDYDEVSKRTPTLADIPQVNTTSLSWPPRPQSSPACRLGCSQSSRHAVCRRAGVLSLRLTRRRRRQR